jgi:hypothetical protein
MTRNVVGLFDDVEHARMAVQELRDMGIPNSDIGFAAHDTAGDYGREFESGREGAATGAVAGGVLGGLGGLLVGLGVLAIPGVGPILAAGPLAAALGTLAGAGVGAAAGGLIGALIDMGLPEEEAQYYAEGVRRGGTLVTVQAPDHRLDEVRQVMDRHGAVNVRERAEAWRERGWAGYDAEAEPYTTEQVYEERRMYAPMTFGAYEPGFRGHYQTTFGRSGYQYDHYRPAYEYGWRLRQDERYRDRDWDQVEPDARRDWETRNPGSTWDEIKAAVRHAWESTKDAVRDIGRD